MTGSMMVLYVLHTLSGLRRHGEQRDDPEADPAGHGLDVHPEGDPRDEHGQRGGQVALCTAQVQ